MIDLKTTLNIAIRSLKINKMRSALTSLGIIIGVCAVIVMLAVGTGSREKIAKDMESMGSNLLMVRSASAKSGGVRMGMGTRPTLTLKDAEAIESKARGVLAIAPYSAEAKQLTFGNQNWSTSVGGTTAPYLFIRNYEIESGRNFIPEDIKNNTKVAILGQTVANELFGDMDPINKTIRIGGIPFKVVGLLKTKGQSGMGQDQDDLVFIPITTAQKKVFGTSFPGTVSIISVKAQDDQIIETTQKDIEEILKYRHHIGKTQNNDFEIRNLAQMQETIKSSARTMSLFLFVIAFVSLLVGGIGIMNIMLVSVTERTREIGIRKALGATYNNILLQFLVESMVIGIIGGTLGVILGIGASCIISSMAGWNTVISVWAIVIAVIFSVGIGLFFGIYPARKAALLDPIDALRYE